MRLHRRYLPYAARITPAGLYVYSCFFDRCFYVLLATRGRGSAVFLFYLLVYAQRTYDSAVFRIAASPPHPYSQYVICREEY